MEEKGIEQDPSWEGTQTHSVISEGVLEAVGESNTKTYEEGFNVMLIPPMDCATVRAYDFTAAGRG